MMISSDNQLFSLATDLVSNTSQSVFLTGKAGTGKTTFLHHIRNTVDKNVIVAAPTGVAAINAGGVTLHSLMQLPFEAFTPNYEGKKKLDYHGKMHKTKIEMLRELELLIIDEVSMLRADMLDAIDYLLRRYRNSQLPFGGVQMLLIGDLFQLPPVVQNEEWHVLKDYYASPFFFHAQAFNGNLPLYIELKKIYRQSDQEFIGILNRIRNNETTPQDLQRLNENYNPSFSRQVGERYVTLCTHNYKADQINQVELERLSVSPFVFEGKVGGNFAENSYPTELKLSLKVGAQIMFVKNDTGEERRYYNGKLGVISFLSDEKLIVRFENDSEMELEKETWRNVRYTLNEQSGEIEEEELGYFSQYPIRLAWAITIHKSQGLTFDKVVIDAGQAFAAGQVYVALSRCTSLDGIVLHSRITSASIQTDREALSFAKEEIGLTALEDILAKEKPNYCAQRLKKVFDWNAMLRTTRAFYELASEKKIPNQEKVKELASSLCGRVLEQEVIAKGFSKELDRMLYVSTPDTALLQERVQKAAVYFHKDIQEHILAPLDMHLQSLKNATRVKLYLEKAKEIKDVIAGVLYRLENIYFGNLHLTKDVEYITIPVEEDPQEAPQVEKKVAQKGDSQKLSLSLFKEGKSIEEIAIERNVKVRTVEDHLISFVKTGELKTELLISADTIHHLSELLKEYTLFSALKSIKESIPEKYSYFEIKVVLNHIYYCKKNMQIN